MVCSSGVRYGGVGGDTVASLRAAAVSERQQEVEDASLARDRTRYRDAKDEYRRCQALGIVDKGFHSIAWDYGIPLVRFCHFNKGQYQEGPDSIDTDDDSSTELSTGDF